ncbi:tRNA (cytidine(34)-2'-O)-methyltransferase [Telmatocola sphagniphila]|uniref:Putative tRNA (cytidine(34)-2'-O)-methyltransferase n=1 Tax=Telmatocola sphagniphila TaxID=1123043 RepID=A0A8E6EV78_9BACT|nr:tRNA (cytidine(34)-2'-O)-methyltransferase [Telmatocola sphagniphila]QVL32242.1 tRNA (cytidine(34)-2'-O)-methyltransferase [Telmatocola sphagniphila]
MMHVALWEPEIPPNTGNIARLCAATGSRLHLIGRLGFRTDAKSLRRAGLDYWESVDLVFHDSFEEFERAIPPEKILCIETNGEQYYTQARFEDGDCLLFGNESSGLPATILDRFRSRTFGIPMPTGKVRSINLATSAGIVLYEALRQVNNW